MKYSRTSQGDSYAFAIYQKIGKINETSQYSKTSQGDSYLLPEA
jgi:hypothetical protein